MRIQSAASGLHAGPAMTPVPPRTHGITVLGWVTLCFSLMPVAMGLSGDGRGYGWAGLAMVGAGAAMVLIGRRLTFSRRR
ncbi:MAG: hypothetical protein AB1Z65_07640 [Candidatus Sulfomarinibacteraceae bacterium]